MQPHPNNLQSMQNKKKTESHFFALKITSNMDATAVIQKSGTEAIANHGGIKSIKFSAERCMWFWEMVTSGHFNLLIKRKNISITTIPKAAHNKGGNFFLMPQ